MESVSDFVKRLAESQNDLGSMIRIISQIPPNLTDSVQSELESLANTDWALLKDVASIRLAGRKA